MLFHEPTENIYNWIQQQPNVKEESITDWLLFDLSRNSNRLKYYAFTRHEERINGADWEWWVLTTNHAYRFRVQAKKLKPRADNYSSVCYSNINGLQIDILLESAENSGAYPLYMFYSVEPQETASVSSCYPVPELIEMIKWCEPCSTGVYFSPAYFIYDEVLAKPKRRINADTLINISMKLSTLDWFFQTSKDIDRAVEALLNSLNRDFKHKNEHGFTYGWRSGINGYSEYRTVPDWLSFICGEERPNNMDLADWFEGEFRHQLPNVSGVAVLDLRRDLQRDK